MTKNESGRSMVEMLGVLAIIGVLSVGGIAGYTMAMKKYRTNEILNQIMMSSILCQSNQNALTDTSLVTTACTNKGSTGEVTISNLYSGITEAELDAALGTGHGSIASGKYTPS